MPQENSFEIIHLFDLLAMDDGDSLFKLFADSFYSLNTDVEQFLKEKAIQSTKLNTSSTYLIVSTDKYIDLLGYFTLATKMLTVKHNILSKREEKIISNFGYYDDASNSFILPAILIAQISRNFNVTSSSINGSDLIDITLKQVKEILNLTSGKVVFLESEPDMKVIDFYFKHGFHLLDNAILSNKNKELVQLYRVI